MLILLDDISLCDKLVKWFMPRRNGEGVADEASQFQSEKPQMLRDNNKFGLYYEPRFVSLGPCHYGNPKLQEGQRLKHKILGKLFSNDQEQLNVMYENLLSEIEKVGYCHDKNLHSEIEKAIYCHDENIISRSGHLRRPKIADTLLVVTMILDGCFILYYIKCVVEERVSRADLEMKGHLIAIVQDDLFLLENQLPFFVLRLLMINWKILTEDQWVQKVSMFIQKSIMAPDKKVVLEPLINSEVEQPAHLLELLHRRMVSSGSHTYTKPKPYQFIFPSLKELTAVGIQLKPACTSHLTEIDYDSSIATLKIPSITIDGSTKSKLLNLIAYEMCNDAESDLIFASYVSLMDLLIHDLDDVKELRSANILHNFLHSDDEVAQLFNEIGASLRLITLTYKREEMVRNLQKMKEDYEEKKMGYMNKMRRYKKELKTGYFKNPWTIFALIGAVLGLLMTGLQTGFQIWSSFTSECDGLCKNIKMTHHI